MKPVQELSMLRKKYLTAIISSKEGFLMKFYGNLYVSESLEKKKDKIIERLKNGKFQLSCYVIMLTENPKNQLEFFDSILLMQRNYKKENPFIVGIANCYDEALLLVQKMTEDAYLQKGNADIRGYILGKQKEFDESRV